MTDDLLATAKAAVAWADREQVASMPCDVDWLRALVARCEQAEADLAALRQRHAEAEAENERCRVAFEKWGAAVLERQAQKEEDGFRLGYRMGASGPNDESENDVVRLWRHKRSVEGEL